MILHHWERIFLLLHFSLDGARRLLCRAAQPITHMSGSGTGRLQLYRKALCCCARSLLIRSDNLNEQSSKWRTKGKYCWQICSASCATPNPNCFKKEAGSISPTPKWEISNIHLEISLWRCWIFKLTFFPFNNYCNTNHWSDSLVKKLVLGELSAERTQSWCSEIKRSLPWGQEGLHRRCVNRHKANTGDSAKNTMRTWWIRAELQPRAQLQALEHRTSFLQGSNTQARRVFAFLCLKHYHLLALYI